MSKLDPKNLPENIRRCMEPRVRKELKTPTVDEALQKQDRKEELEMHRQLEAYCGHADIAIVHSRTDKKSTTKKGTPDFVLLWNGRGCAIELKGPHGKLTDEQRSTLQAWMEKSKVPCLVSSNLAQAIDWARKQLGMPPRGTSV